MQAVILAAGRGERMRPLTDEIPKCLLTINGEPVIDQIIALVKKTGIEKVVIVAGYLKEEIIDHLQEKNISFCYQNNPAGTANALLCAKDSLSSDFISLAADTIFDQADLNSMIAEFNETNPDILVGIRKAPVNELARRSTVKVCGQKIEQIIEKPLAGHHLSDISAMPIFIFKTSIWKYIDNVKPSKNGKYELATAIQHAIDDGLRVEGHFFSWAQDITYPSDVS